MADGNLEDVDSNQKGFSSLLKFAVLGNVTVAIVNRLNRGDLINAQDKNGLTVLMYAARKGNLEVVNLLLSFGADPIIKNNAHQTAIELSEIAGFVEVTQALTAQFSKTEDSIDSHTQSEFFDLSGWLEDSEILLPSHEIEIGTESNRIQNKILSHKPIDQDEEWTDIEIELPGKIAWVRKKEQLSFSDKALIKEAIYLGYSNGAIPISLLEKIALDEKDELDEVFLDTLVLAFEDLEFKIQYFFYVDVELKVWLEDDYLDDLYDQLIYFIDNNLQDESWFYRSLTIPLEGGSLLTREEEIDLGKQIDSSYEECINSIVSNRLAISIIADDFKKVLNGSLEIEEMISEKVEVVDEDDSLIQNQLLTPLDDSVEEERNETNTFDPQIKEFLGLVERDNEESFQYAIHKLLFDLNINFKYIQNLIFFGQLKDATLSSHIEDALKARNKLVTSNLRLVSHVSRVYRYTDLPFSDLVQEGFIGLIKAAERYEYKRGFRFTTYATWWIRQAVSRMVQDKSRTIRLPVHLGDLLNKIDRVERALIDVPLHKKNNKIAEVLGISELRVQRAKSAKFTMISIDSEDPNDQICLDSLGLPSHEDESALSNWMLRRSFESIFKSMDPKEVGVIKKRFGWYDGVPLTLEEVGELHGVTRERIRQIEAKAFKRLQGPSALRHLGLISNKPISES
ncbi:sigma-70 family RNA polymerase sigma factor [Polynucleobacter rarus]|uniref:sigma-70 family RNA polymerase sigma factor n=1 Tax=Polynucleobacter rarus TaxID=556055 RepID=UPI00131EDBE5|nr:sigma-70 family RNA polymerase sigma factor [Polynucleobacter rarus]